MDGDKIPVDFAAKRRQPPGAWTIRRQKAPTDFTGGAR